MSQGFPMKVLKPFSANYSTMVQGIAACVGFYSMFPSLVYCPYTAVGGIPGITNGYHFHDIARSISIGVV